MWFTLGKWSAMMGSKGRKVKTIYRESQWDTVTEHWRGQGPGRFLAREMRCTVVHLPHWGRRPVSDCTDTCLALGHPMCSDQQLELSSSSSALHRPSPAVTQTVHKLWERVFYASFIGFLCKRPLTTDMLVIIHAIHIYIRTINYLLAEREGIKE